MKSYQIIFKWVNSLSVHEFCSAAAQPVRTGAASSSHLKLSKCTGINLADDWDILVWSVLKAFGGLVYLIRNDGKTQPEKNRLQYNFSSYLQCQRLESSATRLTREDDFKVSQEDTRLELFSGNSRRRFSHRKKLFSLPLVTFWVAHRRRVGVEPKANIWNKPRIQVILLSCVQCEMFTREKTASVQNEFCFESAILLNAIKCFMSAIYSRKINCFRISDKSPLKFHSISRRDSSRMFVGSFRR
jgi:hypothetical protein